MIKTAVVYRQTLRVGVFNSLRGGGFVPVTVLSSELLQRNHSDYCWRAGAGRRAVLPGGGSMASISLQQRQAEQTRMQSNGGACAC